jgi:anti-sigma factor RsiW
MKLSHQDELLLQRHLDGELDPAAAAAFHARLAAEPALARALDDARALRTGFLAGREFAMRPPASFTAAVLAAARGLPGREQLQRMDLAASGIRICRRLLVAAAVVAGIGLLWQAGLVRLGTPAVLQASPGEMQRVIDELDAVHNSGAVPPPRLEDHRGK